LNCLGFRQDVPAILNEVDLVVHTAHQEPLGRQVSAVLVRPDDLEALTAAIRRMLTDRELRARLGQQARTRAIEKFSLPAAAAHVAMFWKSFL